MDDLACAQIGRLHKEFLDASDRFPRLHFMAVMTSPGVDIEAEPHWEWPMRTDNPEWTHIFRFICDPADILATTGVWLGDQRGFWAVKHEPEESTAWTGVFLYGHLKHRTWWWNIFGILRSRKGVREFIRLASSATALFLPPGTDTFGGEFTESTWLGDEKRWLAELWRLGLFESISDHRFTVLRLRGNLFATSAQAVEMLAKSSDSLPNSQEPETQPGGQPSDGHTSEPEPGSSANNGSPPNDPITLRQMAMLGVLDLGTVRNWGLVGRPLPAMPQQGQRPAIFSYRDLREWFMARRPDRESYWPESYKKALANLAKMSK